MTKSPHPLRYVRLSQIIGSSKSDTNSTGLIPVSAATIWRMVARGDFPKPVKLGPRMTAWSMDSIEAWLKARQEASK